MTSASPGLFGRPNSACTDDLRKSTSTSSTLAEAFSASAPARLMDVDGLPIARAGLVTVISRGFLG